MVRRTVSRVFPAAVCAGALLLAAGCGGSATAPTPTPKTDAFTGTVQPLGSDFKVFTIVAQGTSDLSVTINSLTTVAAATPVTGITIGVGIGTVSGTTCALQVNNAAAVIGQELFAPNGASNGTYCVQIFDVSTLTEAVTYSLTVKHY
jgi:hypothetical protein